MRFCFVMKSIDYRELVVIIDKHMTLNTEKVFYNLKTNIASYPQKGTIIDNEKTIHFYLRIYLFNYNVSFFKNFYRF